MTPDDSGWDNEAQRTSFLRLDKWLREIARKVPLSLEERLIGNALIVDHRIALGLPPLLGSCANAPPKIPGDAQIEAGRLGRFGAVIPLTRKP